MSTSMHEVDVTPLARDELERVVSMLCTRFPDYRQDEIAAVVEATYERLARDARLRMHLIPLTVNRSRCILAAGESAGAESAATSVIVAQSA